MKCEDTQHMLDAYLDGELDLVRSLDIEQHLRTCVTCSTIYRNRLILRQAIGNEQLYFRPSSSLELRVKRALHSSDKESGIGRFGVLRWAIPVALIALAFAAGLLWRTAASPSTQDQLADEILASHVRSLLVAHLTDITSTDQHTVKPWFDGKLDFSPPVVDLASADFPLIGGRLDYVDHRAVAALIYQRRKRVIINLFIWPSQANDPPIAEPIERQGYQIVH